MTNEHSLRLLEFVRVQEDVAGYCLSEEGRDLLLSEFPRDDAVEVRAIKDAVGRVVGLFQEGVEPPSLSFPPIGLATKRIAKLGSALELEELYALGLWSESFAGLVGFMGKTLGERSVEDETGQARPRPAAAAVQPAAVQPAAVQPAAVQPAAVQPAAVQPAAVQPAAVQPAAVQPAAETAAEADPLRWSQAASPLIPGLVAAAPELQGVARIVFRIVNKDGSLRDLPELKAARDRIARAHRDISALTDSFFRSAETKSMLQSDAPTIRDGRTVLALRANFRGRIKGIVHEVSATGQTVFLEPEELVQKNNELVQEEARYLQELNRILREATESLLPYAPAVAAARAVAAALDGIYARARHARLSGLFMARDLAEGFELRKARHPLLGRRAVPIDVVLPAGTRTLIVTGPNTGGKTVTLKTIGLLALMNQFGLGIPASLESGLAVFDEVFADIGDEQSIDQSLSTFSGHMRVIGAIADRAGPRGLVLLDELGSGTDPEEGCAVAMGLLDWFIGRGCLTILTTHHGVLKNYGYTRPGCLNASMDFDATSLQPTYRVLMGVPGESRALDVASQNGLRTEVIEGARRYLAEERADVSILIKGLTEKHRHIEDLEVESRARLKDAREEQRKTELSRLKLRQKELQLREQGVGELKRLLAESRKNLENLVKDLREGELTPEKTRAVKDFIARFSEAVELEGDKLEAAQAEATAEQVEIQGAEAEAQPAVFCEGAAVLIGTGRKKGVLVRPAKKGSWIVETGSLRMTVSESELAMDRTEVQTKTQVAVELAPRGEGGRTSAVFELDLRGYRLMEALQAVEQQLDAASLQGLSLFSIIHGTGEGILGKGIQDFLRKHPAVADYHFARPEEGGYGKTVVRLK
jgi:DNA mismatch repair protein MutS2